uniref:Uncharacterized protein n=1 Tax=Tetranychus urticae TaxID=32264 RepID=T1KJX2_TETUR
MDSAFSRHYHFFCVYNVFCALVYNASWQSLTLNIFNYMCLGESCNKNLQENGFSLALCVSN